MHASTTTRVSLATLTSISLTLLLASQVVAANWDAPVALSTSGYFPEGGGIVATGPKSAAAVYLQGRPGEVQVKRTANSGSSWGAPLTLATQGWNPQIAGFGAKVDVVWIESEPFLNPSVRYARSTNGARSFRGALELSPTSDVAEVLSVARGSDSRVAVVWTDVINSGFSGPLKQRVRIRISEDDGASFGKTKTVATGKVLNPAVAIDDGVVFVAYEARRELVVRTSSDFGATWSTPAVLATDFASDPGPYIAAAEGQAFVSYAGGVYRRSTDGGHSWSSPVNLTRPAGKGAGAARIAINDGIVRAAFEQNCFDTSPEPTDKCATRVKYRRSKDGVTWTRPQVVSTYADRLNRPLGIAALAGEVLVAYFGGPDWMLYVRHGTE